MSSSSAQRFRLGSVVDAGGVSNAKRQRGYHDAIHGYGQSHKGVRSRRPSG